MTRIDSPTSNILVGTYIENDRYSVYCVALDADGKTAHAAPWLCAGQNPSWLEWGGAVQSGESAVLLYAVNELCKKPGEHDDRPRGVLCTFAVQPGGAPTSQHSAPPPEQVSCLSTYGDSPAHIAASQKHKIVIVVNYSSGTMCVYPLSANGTPVDNPYIHTFPAPSNRTGVSQEVDDRQEAAHPHQCAISPCGDYALVTDLGVDRVYIFKLEGGTQRGNESAPTIQRVGDVQLPAGTGPRHMAFSSNGTALFISGELSSSVVECSYAPGHVRFVRDYRIFPNETLSYPRTSTSEIVWYDNKIYIANRGDDSISVFARQSAGGKLHHVETFSCHGKTPRHIAIIPHAPWGPVLVSANQDSGTLAFFAVGETEHRFITLCDVPYPSRILAW